MAQFKRDEIVKREDPAVLKPLAEPVAGEADQCSVVPEQPKQSAFAASPSDIIEPPVEADLRRNRSDERISLIRLCRVQRNYVELRLIGRIGCHVFAYLIGRVASL